MSGTRGFRRHELRRTSTSGSSSCPRDHSPPKRNRHELAFRRQKLRQWTFKIKWLSNPSRSRAAQPSSSNQQPPDGVVEGLYSVQFSSRFDHGNDSDEWSLWVP
jgi:hypothetical protein